MGWSSEVMDQGLQAAVWPARMQRLKAGPLVAALPEGSELWLDGGHNPHAARALRAHIDRLQVRDPKPLHLICGLINTKDATEFFAHFKGLEAKITCVGFSSEAVIPPAELAARAAQSGFAATVAESVTEAMSRITDGPARVLICGSLYLAGDVLALSSDTWPV